MIHRQSPSDRTLLCLSSLAESAVAEGAVDVPGQVALDAAADFPVGFAFGLAALDVGEGGRVAAHAADRDDMQCPVELPVAEAVEAVAVGPPGGHRDGGRCRTASRRPARWRSARHGTRTAGSARR